MPDKLFTIRLIGPNNIYDPLPPENLFYRFYSFDNSDRDGPNEAVTYLGVPKDILVYDFLASLSQRDPPHITHVHTLYRHVSNGYKKAKLKERLISGNPNLIETFLVINEGPKNKTEEEVEKYIMYESGRPLLNTEGLKWLFGPRPAKARYTPNVVISHTKRSATKKKYTHKL